MVAAANRDLYLNVQCRNCRDIVHLNVNEKDVIAWRNGRSIQDAMPYLTAGEREILISGICEPCFDTIFSSDESDNE